MIAQRKPPLSRGMMAALATPIFLGMAPIFGKLAIEAGADPFSVAALRTFMAVFLLFAVYVVFMRQYLFIYPAGLSGCIIIGTINGIGSLFYYSGLGLLDASLVQLLNGTYLVFALMLSRIGGEKVSLRVVIRVILALVALVLITGFTASSVSWLGVGLMLGAALMFAGTVIFSQYVLFEMPPQTATFYILATMAVIVGMAWMPVGQALPENLGPVLWPIFWLGVTTALGRLLLFAGVKFLGSLQTAIVAIVEIGVALLLAFLVLEERLEPTQWVGVGLLAITLLLIRSTDLRSTGINPNTLLIANNPSMQFQRIAFHRAFGTRELDNESNTMASVTTMEMVAIQRMMGVDNGPVDPFPLVKLRAGLEEHQGGFRVDLTKFLDEHDAQNSDT